MNGRLAVCIGCGRRVPIGALIAVEPHNPLAGRYFVHRHTLDARCFVVAGPESFSGIRLADAAEAREFDRLQATIGAAIHA